MRPDTVRLGSGDPEAFVSHRVEAELSSLWKTARRDGTGGVFRACRGTLILPLAPGENLLDLVDPLSERFPARFLVVREDPGLSRVQSSATASCRLDETGGGLVCSEVVLLEGPPSAGPPVASAIRSLAVGGLPRVVLGDRRPLSSHPWAGELGILVDAIVGDTTGADAPEAEEFWNRATTVAYPAYLDVAWVRISCWRRMLTGAWRSGMRDVKSITMRGRDDPGGRNAASLLGGWILDHLGGDTPVRFLPANPGEGRILQSVTVSGKDWEMAAGEDHPLMARDRNRSRSDRLLPLLNRREGEAAYRSAAARGVKVATQ